MNAAQEYLAKDDDKPKQQQQQGYGMCARLALYKLCCPSIGMPWYPAVPDLNSAPAPEYHQK